MLAAYVKYGEANALASDLLTSEEGHVVVKFIGRDAGRLFRHEPGKHCVQRVPPSEKKGRRHTSMVTVAVLPMPPEEDPRPLPADELEVKTQPGHGPGGQHQNKTASAVRMTHRPTGLQVFINGRDQHSNRREALRILTARVKEHLAEQRNEEYARLRRSQRDGGGRGNKVRTYNFIGGGRIVDHRLGVKTHKVKEVMKGRFELLFEQGEPAE